MSRIFFVLFFVLFFGCKHSVRDIFFYNRENIVDYSKMNFEKSLDSKRAISVVGNNVSIRFEAATFSSAMRMLSERCNVTIVWSKELDNYTVSGLFTDQSVDFVLSSLARRYGVQMSRVGQIYYLGLASLDDVVTAVFRLPPSSSSEVLPAIKSVLSTVGNVSVVGSVVWVSDRFEFVQKVLSDLSTITEMLNKSYIAEVFFIRMSEDAFSNLAADLRLNSVDVFSSAFNIEQLFSCVVSGDFGFGGTVVDSRPVLYLSEGRQVRFDFGNTVTVAKKAVNERGVIETIGYDKFSDGLVMSLMLNRVFDGRYSLDFDLSLSTFDTSKNNESGVPNLHNQVLKIPGILCNDNCVCFVGQLQKSSKAKNFSLFGFDGSVTRDLTTVWLRVREVK
jgi:hypothetical protein